MFPMHFNIPQDLFFAKEKGFLLLIFLPIIVLLYAWLFYKRSKIQNLFSEAQKIQLLVPRKNAILKLLFLCFVWLSATLALSDPRGDQIYRLQNLKAPELEITFLLDSSLSMGVRDAAGGKTRLGFAKEIMRILESKFSLHGNNVILTLITFDQNPFLAIPPTEDFTFFHFFLDMLVPTGSTNLLKALIDFPSLLEKKGGNLIIFTDGEETSPDKKLSIADIHPLKTLWKTLIVPLGTVQGGQVEGILYQGKPAISRLDLPFLKKINAALSGSLLDTNSKNEEEVAQTIMKHLLSSEKQNYIKTVRSQLISSSYMGFFLGFSLLFLAIFLMLSDTKAVFILLFFAIPFQIPASQDLIDAISLAEAGANHEAEALFDLLQEDREWILATWNRAVLLAPLYPSHALLFFETLPDDLPLNWQKVLIKEKNKLLRSSSKRSASISEFDPKIAFEELAFSLYKKEPYAEIEEKQNRFLENLKIWQEKQFLGGECQNVPWETFFPLFKKGALLLSEKKGKEEETTALLFFARALRTLYMPFKKPHEPCEKLKPPNALLEGMRLDADMQNFLPPKPSPSEKPW